MNDRRREIRESHEKAVYIALFKCRICCEVYSATETESRNIAQKAAISAVLGKVSDGQDPALHDIHICEDGGIGIADFLGFKREDEEEL